MLNVIEGLVESAQGLRGDLTILLENTVGAGGQIGSRFEELEAIRRLAQDRMELPIGFCIDTCHCFASGHYNVGTPEGLKETVRQMKVILGVDRVGVIHANDSKGDFGSKLDRHANIGEGKIGNSGFEGILRHKDLRNKPFILETPVDAPGDDRKNMDALKELSARRTRAEKHRL